jgi:hypothetical protein
MAVIQPHMSHVWKRPSVASEGCRFHGRCQRAKPAGRRTGTAGAADSAGRCGTGARGDRLRDLQRTQGIFRLDDGQVWREIESSPTHQRLAPDRAYPARIERGTLGGFHMYVDGVRRMKKVERLE